MTRKQPSTLNTNSKYLYFLYIISIPDNPLHFHLRIRNVYQTTKPFTKLKIDKFPISIHTETIYLLFKFKHQVSFSKKERFKYVISFPFHSRGFFAKLLKRKFV